MDKKDKIDKIDNVDKIEKKQFYGNRELVSYVVPEMVTEIGDWAFARCRRLKWIAVPKGLERIGREAFAGCESLAVAYFYEGHWEEVREGSGKDFGKELEKEKGLVILALSEKQRVEGELMALALRHFLEVQSIVGAMREKTLAVEECASDMDIAGLGMAAGTEGWIKVWDEACIRFLQRPDEEGFVPFLAGGEEDYADDGERYAAYCRKALLMKADMVYRRLLADFMGTEWELGLSKEMRALYQAALREKDGDLEILMRLEGNFREAVEIYEAAGILTQEKILEVLERLPEDRIELRALLMEKRTGNFLDELAL